jgi:hypothetical protein
MSGTYRISWGISNSSLSTYTFFQKNALSVSVAYYGKEALVPHDTSIQTDLASRISSQLARSYKSTQSWYWQTAGSALCYALVTVSCGRSFWFKCRESRRRPMKLLPDCGIPWTRSLTATPYKLTHRGSILPSNGLNTEILQKSLDDGYSGTFAKNTCDESPIPDWYTDHKRTVILSL